jgi:signal transduction histidine kinase
LQGGGADTPLVTGSAGVDLERTVEDLAKAILKRSEDVAHDLKTPLNIVVLNVELLKMRLRSLDGEAADDAKVAEHCRSIEREARRVSAIVDAFLGVASIPKEQSRDIDAAAVLAEELREMRFEVGGVVPRFDIRAYPSRWGQACRLLAAGVARVVDVETSRVTMTADAEKLTLDLEGEIASNEVEFGKLFKFYYTDPSGEPDPSLAAARLLIESAGGSIEAHCADGMFHLSLVLNA